MYGTGILTKNNFIYMHVHVLNLILNRVRPSLYNYKIQSQTGIWFSVLPDWVK